MKPDCKDFRRLLETKLVGAPSPTELSQLSWHEHLLACGDCRRILESEEALEELLATLPNPRLSPLMTARVLARLRSARGEDAALEALLDRDREPATPAGLAERVLARLEDERRLGRATSAGASSPNRRPDRNIDALLDADREIIAPKDLVSRVQRGIAAERAASPASAEARLDRLLERDVVVAPAGIAGRVIAALETARRAETVRAPRFAPSTRWVYAAAATLLAALVAWLVWTKRSEPKTTVAQIAPTAEYSTNPAQPDDQMLAVLPALENWERLGQVDVLLSTLGPADEALLEYQEAETTPAPAPQPKEPETRSPETHSKG